MVETLALWLLAVSAVPVVADTAQCGDSGTLSAELSAAVDREVHDHGNLSPRLRIAEEDGLVAEIVFVAADGSTSPLRRIHSRRHDCAALMRSVILVIVTALDAERQHATVLSAEAPATPVTAKTEPLRLRVGAGFDTALGILPQFAAGGRATVGLVRRSLSFEVGVQWLQGTVFEAAETRIDAFVVDGQAAACYTYRSFFGCAAFAAGAMRSRVLDRASNVAVSPWVAAGARVGYCFSPPAPWALRLFAELWVPLTKTTLTLDDRTLWQSAPIAGTAGLAVDFLSRL